jgi:hypothetical protein
MQKPLLSANECLAKSGYLYKEKISFAIGGWVLTEKGSLMTEYRFFLTRLGSAFVAARLRDGIKTLNDSRTQGLGELGIASIEQKVREQALTTLKLVYREDGYNLLRKQINLKKCTQQLFEEILQMTEEECR